MFRLARSAKPFRSVPSPLASRGLPSAEWSWSLVLQRKVGEYQEGTADTESARSFFMEHSRSGQLPPHIGAQPDDRGPSRLQEVHVEPGSPPARDAAPPRPPRV